MANLKLRKKVSAKTFNEIRLKMVGKKFDRAEMYEILTNKCELKRSYYLPKVLVDMRLIRMDDNGNYYFPDDYPATDPLLEQAMIACRKMEAPKKTSDYDEKKALQALLNAKNEDGTPKYEIRRRVPARWEVVTL